MINAKKYRSNSVTKWRAHWSLKTRCRMLPSNIARKQKILLGRLFFKGADAGIIVDGVDVITEFEVFSMKVYENEEEQKLMKEEERAEEKEKTAKEAGRRKRGHRKKRPTKKRVDKF